jgi:hypothetical protein
MKTNTISFIIAAMLIVSIVQSQTVTSIANGNFLYPTTWDCGCVPSPGDNIIIKHHVVLNTNWGFSSGSLTIDNGGSLIKDASIRSFAMNGGTFTNNGYFYIDRFAAYTGTLNNSDSMHVTQALYNSATFTNSGTIYGLDSFYTANSLHITNTGTIAATNFMNTLTVQNDGIVNFTYFLNTGSYSSTGITSAFQFLNSGISVLGDTLNILDDFTNAGIMTVDSNVLFLVAHDFLNSDTTAHHAVFNNNGGVQIGNDFTNVDTLKGDKGTFCVAAFSTNTGYFKGTIDFCDQTPMNTVPINIDLNTGVIGANVTSCTQACKVLTGITENKQETTSLHVYPNPFIDEVTFETNDNGNPEIKLYIFNILGQQVFSHIYTQNKIILNNNDLNNCQVSQGCL